MTQQDKTHTSQANMPINGIAGCVARPQINIMPSVPFDLAVKVSGGMEGGLLVRRSTIVVMNFGGLRRGETDAG